MHKINRLTIVLCIIECYPILYLEINLRRKIVSFFFTDEHTSIRFTGFLYRTQVLQYKISISVTLTDIKMP